MTLYICKNMYIPGRWDSGTAEMKDMRPARPKNLATNTVAWPWDSGLSIHCKQGRKIHDSLHPFRKTRHPLQLISQLLVFCRSSLSLKRKGKKKKRKAIT